MVHLKILECGFSSPKNLSGAKKHLVSRDLPTFSRESNWSFWLFFHAISLVEPRYDQQRYYYYCSCIVTSQTLAHFYFGVNLAKNVVGRLQGATHGQH